MDGRRRATANVSTAPLVNIYNFLVSVSVRVRPPPPLSLFFTCLRKFPRRDRGGSHVKRRETHTERETLGDGEALG